MPHQTDNILLSKMSQRIKKGLKRKPHMQNQRKENLQKNRYIQMTQNDASTPIIQESLGPFPQIGEKQIQIQIFAQRNVESFNFHHLKEFQYDLYDLNCDEKDQEILCSKTFKLDQIHEYHDNDACYENHSENNLQRF
ncbi:unnamed protein product [Paramecium sonneborni]|uniref:Uncharacterized protein n=1 Tax=Paramecium sonneborni TaxID=65129 RepID=A0A8S1P6V0_9CILI|nr:unnamed protein product [Paramecium sonneborni]